MMLLTNIISEQTSKYIIVFLGDQNEIEYWWQNMITNMMWNICILISLIVGPASSTSRLTIFIAKKACL